MFPCEDSWCFIIDLLCCQGCCVWLPCYCQVLAWQSLLLVGLLVISCGLSRNVTGTYPRCNNFDISMLCFKYLQLNNSITVCFRSATFSHPNDFLFHGSLWSQNTFVTSGSCNVFEFSIPRLPAYFTVRLHPCLLASLGLRQSFHKMGAEVPKLCNCFLKLTLFLIKVSFSLHICHGFFFGKNCSTWPNLCLWKVKRQSGWEFLKLYSLGCLNQGS